MGVTRDELERMPDEHLMRLVADMDASAFEVLYDRHAQAVYSLCLRIVHSQALADDVSQEALLSVWRSGGRYKASLGSVRSWMLSIAHNRAIDQVRRTRRHDDRKVDDETAAEQLPAHDSTDVEALRRIEADDTGRALESLPGEQRKVIELAFYSGFTHTEIAARLKVPLGTVKGRMRLALEKLQVLLAEAP